MSRSFHVMTKPIGPLCNLDCKYCFYLEKEKLFPEGEQFRMSDEVLETYVRQYIQCQTTPELQFAWQGGEPTLLGLDFFRKVVALQRQYAGGRPVHNSFQTNGTNLDDEWCRFFAQEKFLIGLSLDGPAPIHDRYRVDKGGTGSFERVMNALALLKKWRVEFNTLTCVTRQSPDEAVEIYNFLKQQGVRFMQFIPIVERKEDGSGEVQPWAVSPDGFGQFLCSIFDEWIKTDVGRVFVNIFDMALGAWCGQEPNLCTFSRRCGQAVAMEHDGGVYSCDHYVYPDYFLGNIMEKPLEEMVYSERQVKFGNDKRDALPNYCRECEFLFVCNGECPKHRFINTPDGEPGLNYLCAGYKKFFRHIDPQMRAMAALVKKGRPAAEIMKSAPILVNGETVPDELIAQELQMLRERYAREMPPEEVERKQAKIESDARENAVERVLLMQQARAEIGAIRPEEIEARLAALKNQHGGKGFEWSAEDEVAIKTDLENGVRLEKYFDQICADVVPPAEAESAAYYEEHKAVFVIPEMVHAAHIIQSPSPERPMEQVYAELLNVRERLLAGEDFNALAQAYSHCRDGAHDLGWFARGQMVPGFEEVAFSTETGKFSDVFQTEFGYHILTVLGRKPKSVRSFEEVRGEVEAMLWDKRKNEAIGAVADKLRAAADIQNLEIVED